MAFLTILWPRRWEFAADPHEVITTYIESPEPIRIEICIESFQFI